MGKYLKECSEQDKNLLLYLLRFVDQYAVEVHAENNTFVAYCKDDERGDMIVQIDCMKPKLADEEESAEKTQTNMEG